MEVIIALALSSLLLMMGYASFEFIYKQFKVFKDKSKEGLSNRLFYSYMYNDVQKAEKITSSGTSSFECVSNNRTIKYYNTDNAIVRIANNRADSFYVNVSEFELTKEINIPEQPVSLIKFEAEFNNTKFPVSINKEYGANLQMIWKDE